MALRAEAEHGEGFVFQDGGVRVFVSINFCGHGWIYDFGFTIYDLKLDSTIFPVFTG